MKDFTEYKLSVYWNPDKNKVDYDYQNKQYNYPYFDPRRFVKIYDAKNNQIIDAHQAKLGSHCFNKNLVHKGCVYWDQGNGLNVGLYAHNPRDVKDRFESEFEMYVDKEDYSNYVKAWESKQNLLQEQFITDFQLQNNLTYYQSLKLYEWAVKDDLYKVFSDKAHVNKYESIYKTMLVGVTLI